ncbi:hypothetical protein Tsubulata_024527 [Turnera subulata]|uniref:RING-type E3 ubiquitin transferase n=1 Tax=Turnera subulata TaxID=218843 RepID=A0A9Q0J5X8_9ROSI|nr:hypothetical protein Tsubulata_024527 [Turnera subulata]
MGDYRTIMHYRISRGNPTTCYFHFDVPCDTVKLEDSDVSKALIEYVFRFKIEVLLLGAGSRNGLSRFFRGTDVPGSLLKWAPAFCTVYVISSKRRICGMRKATRTIPTLPISEGGSVRSQINASPEEISTRGSERWSDDLSTADIDQCEGSIRNRPSTDSTFFAFYENLGTDRTQNHLPGPSHFESTDLMSLGTTFRPSSAADDFMTSSTPEFRSTANVDDKDDEIKRLKTELAQTMEMYHAACKEALAAKMKAMELERWKMEEERRLLEACPTEETPKENVKSTSPNEATETKLVKIEKQNRDKQVAKTGRKVPEEKVVDAAFGQSHKEIEYQCLTHIITALFLFYIYFTIS